MTHIQYKYTKEKLESIGHLNPPIEQFAKYVKIMYQSLCDEQGFLCENEMLDRIVNDIAINRLSKTIVKQLLLWEEN